MSTADELALIKDQIVSAATDGIQTAATDGVSVTKMPIDEQIKAANYVAGRGAAAHPHFGLRFSKMIPPAGG